MDDGLFPAEVEVDSSMLSQFEQELKLAQNVDNFVKSPTLSEMLPLNELFLNMTSSSSRLE